MKTLRLIFLFVALAVTADAGTINGKIVLRGLRGNQDAVVYIEKIPGKTFAPPSAPVVLDQVNLKFTPHVLPILIGTRVEFPNSDEIRHNVFSPGVDRFNLGTYSVGDSRSRVFNTPGEVTLLCNVHVEMSAYIYVTETPYFAVSDVSGNFTINNVPAGTYQLAVWHERLKPQRRTIEVTDTGVTVANFELTR